MIFLTRPPVLETKEIKRNERWGLELTSEMDGAMQKQVARRMVRTAVGTALLLVLLGW
jgi:hypothetical protein